MTRATNMNDANGGRGQLRGYVHDVEFSCGGVPTTTDLWVSQQAPFELLLGRPWQRGNLVSIDEREEGTYLIFKDALTRQPRYELLAIPYERVMETARIGPDLPVNHGLSYIIEEPELRSGVRAKAPLGNSREPTEWERRLKFVNPWTFGRKRTWILGILGNIVLLWLMQSIWRINWQAEEGVNSRKEGSAACGNVKYKVTGVPLYQIPTQHPTSLLHPTTMQFPPPKLNPPQDDPGERQPDRLVSPMGPIPCEVLRREPSTLFGPIDYQPPATNAFSRVRAASSSEWVRHRLGRDPRICPATIEIYHAILLNTRMLIHDPVTGQPGTKSGHVIAHMYATPPGNHPWPMEIPFPSQASIDAALPNYHPSVREEIGRMRRPGQFLMHLDRQVTPSTAGLLDAVGDAVGNARALQLHSHAGSSSTASAPDGQSVLTNGRDDSLHQLQVVPTQGANEPHNALRLAVPRVFANLLGTRPTLPSIAQLGLPTVALQSAAPPRLSLTNGQGPRYPAQSYRFLTHPPNQTPASVTVPMRHAGVWRENGHEVWTVPTGPDAAVHYPNGRAPDTPRPPLRMLDDMPELESRAPTSDAEMPDATDDDAEGSDDKNEVSSSCQRWAVSNCRLEKIQTEARRIADDPSLSQNEAPKFVLNALQLNSAEPEFPSGGCTLEDLANAAAAQKDLENARNDVKEFEVDVENGEQPIEASSDRRINEIEVFLADKRSRDKGEGGMSQESEGDSGHVLRGLESAHGPLFARSDSSLSSLADSLPSLISDVGYHSPPRAVSLPPLVSDSGRLSPAAPLYVDDHDVSVESRPTSPTNQHSFRVATPFSEDCRSTDGLTGFFDDGIFGEGAITYNFPTFSDDSSDEEDPVKLIEAHPTVPNNWPIAKIESATGFDFPKRLNKTVRTMPAKAARERAHNITWIKVRQHTIKHEHQRLRMRAKAIDGLLAPIRRANALILRSPNLIDTVDMGTDNMVDLDMLEQLNAPDHTPAGKARNDAQAHELEEILDVLAPPLLDGSRRFIDSPGVPVSVDGKRYREFSDEAKKLSAVHRLAIKAQVLRRRGPIVVYAIVRGCFLETIRLSEDFIRVHGWELNIVDLHQDTHESPPVLKDDEHARLRLVMYAFARYGYNEVANAIDDLLAHRFYEPTIICNLLEAGMLDPNNTIYVDGGLPGGIKIEARDVTGYPKPKRPFPGRYPRNWTQQVLAPSPIPEAFEDDDSDDGHSQDEGEPKTRRAKL
ncbi:hypothetical protein DFH06DRAFT_1350451 [Mycena polygramma]|nr:hypothetical protein DFH06DRAFT_1350451 [Mycena polygramma]